MQKKITSFFPWLVLFFFSSGCISKDTSFENTNEIKPLLTRVEANFSAVNEKVFEDTVVIFDEKFENFTLSEYKVYWDQYRFKKAKDLKEDTAIFDKIEIFPFKKTFISCLHSTEKKITLCDDPRCPGIEKRTKADYQATVQQWLKDLPWFKCPRNPNTGY